MKFQPNSLNSVQLTERTRNCYHLCYKGNNLKNIHARVMILVLDTSSQCALQMYEVSLIIRNGYQVIERTRYSIANDQREITQKCPKQSYGSFA